MPAATAEAPGRTIPRTNVPLLTAEEEVELARRVRDGDAAARERMVEANTRLVFSVAREYATPGGPAFDDTYADGCTGLLTAVDRFDPERGVRFATYAIWWIKQAVRAGLDSGHAIYVPKYLQDLRSKVRRGKVTPTPEQAGYLDAAEKAWRVVRDGDAADEEAAGYTTLLADYRRGPDEEAELSDAYAAALRYVDRLPERQAEIIRLRFGLGDEPPLILRAVGERLGITHECVRQHEELGLRRLREMATATDPRVTELLRRREARRRKTDTTDDPDEAAARGEPPGIVAALRAKRQQGQQASVASPDQADAAPRVRNPAPAHARCDRCGGRVNTFSQRCPRCDTKAPTTIDARPVRLAEPEPEIAATPDPSPAPPVSTAGLCQRCKKQPVKEGLRGDRPYKCCTECLGKQARRDAKRLDGTAKLTHCPECGGEITSERNRCYRCHPGTPARKSSPPPPEVPAPAAALCHCGREWGHPGTHNGPSTPAAGRACRICGDPLPETAHPNRTRCDECYAKNRNGNWAGNRVIRREKAPTTRVVEVEVTAPPLTAENCRTVKLAPPADPTSPAHYADLDPEPIDVIFAWGWGPEFCRANVLKYVARAGRKDDEAEDLRKAKRYLEILIERLEA